MKLLNCLALSLTIFLHPQVNAVQAKPATPASAMMLASLMGKALSNAKTLNDLVQPGALGTRGAMQAKVDLKGAGIGQLPISHFEVKSGTSIVLDPGKKYSVTIDYSKIRSGTVTVNSTVVNLKMPTDYLKLKTLLEPGLRKMKTASLQNWLLPQAHAEGEMTNEVLRLIAESVLVVLPAHDYYKKLVVQLPASQQQLPDDDLEAALLTAYAYEAGVQTDDFKKPLTERNYMINTFTCENQRLKKIEAKLAIVGGKLSGETDPDNTTFEYLADKNQYQFSSPRSHCRSTASAAPAEQFAVVTESMGEQCPKRNDSIFKNVFFNLPIVAERCCAKIDCAARVQKGLKTLEAAVLDGGGPPGSKGEAEATP